MALGERIKECRQRIGLSQEKVAELVGVSRQAVTKWEVNQSVPSADNLFKLAEIFGISLDVLMGTEDSGKQAQAEQIYHLFKRDEEKKATMRKGRIKRNITTTLVIVSAYLVIYLLGRIIWCDLSDSSFLGWLVTVKPTGEHSYLFGWLLSSNMFWYAMIISSLPALFGRWKFSGVTLTAFIIGLLAGIVFGPNPEGTAIGQSHYGWAIWGVIFVISILAGVLCELFIKIDIGKRMITRGRKEK